MKRQKASQIMLQKEFMSVKKKPRSEFFQVHDLVNENVQVWEVFLIGPPDTLYQNGVYKAHLKFPDEYPMRPPSLQFLVEILHPNIYKDGKVCISTLQNGPDGADELGQYWRPVLGIEQAILSVVSLLSDPNTDDPANTGAASLYKNDIRTFKEKCSQLARKSLESVPPDFVYPTLSIPQAAQEKPAVTSIEAAEDADTDVFEYDPEDLTDPGYEDSEAPSKLSRTWEHDDEKVLPVKKDDDENPGQGSSGKGDGKLGGGGVGGSSGAVVKTGGTQTTGETGQASGEGTNQASMDVCEYSELGRAQSNFMFFDGLAESMGKLCENGAAERSREFFMDASLELDRLIEEGRYNQKIGGKDVGLVEKSGIDIIDLGNDRQVDVDTLTFLENRAEYKPKQRKNSFWNWIKYKS